MTVTSTAAAVGTEVVGGGYVRTTITFAAPSGGSISSNITVNFTNMPGPITVTGVDEWDSAGTPVRRWFGNLSSSKSVNAGDTFSIASASYTKTLS